MKINSNKPKFSIIIPSRNRFSLLAACLESLIGQLKTEDGWEIIVVNDGSEKQLPEYKQIPNQYPQVRYILFAHSGPAAARNYGIKISSGDIILFLDDDSLPVKTWFSSTKQAWQEYPDYDAIGGYIACERDDNIYCKVSCDFFNWYLKESLATGYAFLSTCNAGYKKNILKQVAGFNEDFPSASGEDRDLNIRIHRAGGRLRLDEKIIVYHEKGLNLKDFLKRHFNYGKAAYIIYSKYPQQRHFSPKGYLNLYMLIPKMHKRFSAKFLAAILLTCSQTLAIIGYVTALALDSKKNP